MGRVLQELFEPQEDQLAAQCDALWTDLVRSLEKQRVIRSKKINAAFLRWPRHLFVDQRDPIARRQAAGVNSPVSIDHGQSVSQPQIVAMVMKLLRIKKGEVVLDVGLGSGWQAAILRECVGAKGKVIAIERLAALCESTRKRFQGLGLTDIEVIHGDATNPQDVPVGPFDVITSAAGCKDVPPFWQDRLRRGGRLVYPQQVGEVRNAVVDAPGFDFPPDHHMEDGPIHQLTRIIRFSHGCRVEYRGTLCGYVPLVSDGNG
ncbi:MAG: protein-L-isoaspartate O-methyltransferase [Candidatus Peregrinibacteria bacterium]|nr:protein-L-isoaspartate O-methyltransferase [Candidatus Peregrinibacteria bacterium]